MHISSWYIFLSKKEKKLHSLHDHIQPLNTHDHIQPLNITVNNLFTKNFKAVWNYTRKRNFSSKSYWYLKHSWVFLPRAILEPGNTLPQSENPEVSLDQSKFEQCHDLPETLKRIIPLPWSLQNHPLMTYYQMTTDQRGNQVHANHVTKCTAQ